MFYKLKKGCFIRKYEEYGYITSTFIYHDQVFNESGSCFLSALKRFPQSIEELVDVISENFVDVPKDIIKEDAIEFYNNLVKDGFVVFGETEESCNKNDKGFSYLQIPTIKSIEDFTPDVIRSKNSTQEIMRKQMLKHPHITSFQIEITSKCNERCIHCYIPHQFKNNNMAPELFYKTIDELEKMNVLNVTLSGGEPLTHPNFIEFLKYAKSKDFNVGILSNLTLLSDEIVNVLKEGNTSYVQVSLYSMNAKRHDEITTIDGSFRKTKSAILKLIKNNIPVQISCPVLKTNMFDFIDVQRWAHKHNIRATTDYSIMAEYNHDTSNLVYRLTPSECKSVISKMLSEDKEYQEMILDKDFNGNVDKLNNNSDEPFCGVGISTCCMVANGDIFPCPGWQSMICGNLNNESLEKIWKESEQLNFLRNIKRKDIPACLNCKNKAFCSPCLCRFANESKNGNPLEVATHFCNVAKVNREAVLDYIKNNK